ncbi:MFS transporter [Spiribacter halobius]|nr:MFS transporter [Spiribacter halobius]UEX79213.1 MFS transporter [Spiribacter halobius]
MSAALRAADATMDQAGDPPGCWTGLAVLATALLFGMTTWFSATAVVPQLEAVWAITPAQAAWLTIAVQLGFVAGALGSAILNVADRVPPRRLMLYGATGAAATNALLLVAQDVSVAIALRGLTGMFLAAVYPPAMKAMSTWFRVRRGTALGVMVGALTLGSATPHLVNGLGGLQWQLVIVVTSLVTLAGGLLAEFAGRDGPFPFPRGRFDPRMAWRVFSDRGVRLASLGYFGHMWELYAMWAWFSVFLGDTLSLQGISAAGRWAAIGTFAVIGIGAVGCWLGGVLGDRLGRARATILAMGISGTCAVSIGFLQTAPIPVVVAVGLVWGFWVVADSAQFSTAVTELGRQDYVGTALTLQLAIGFILTIPTIWIIPLIAESTGWRFAFAVLALGPLAGIISMRQLRCRHAG